MFCSNLRESAIAAISQTLTAGCGRHVHWNVLVTVYLLMVNFLFKFQRKCHHCHLTSPLCWMCEMAVSSWAGYQLAPAASLMKLAESPTHWRPVKCPAIAGLDSPQVWIAHPTWLETCVLTRSTCSVCMLRTSTGPVSPPCRPPWPPEKVRVLGQVNSNVKIYHNICMFKALEMPHLKQSCSNKLAVKMRCERKKAV